MMDNLEDDNEDADSVDLNYHIYTDDSSKTVYIKFTGFGGNDQMSTFAEYIEEHLPLLLFNSDTKH